MAENIVLINRMQNNQSVSLTASSATTDEIPYQGFAAGGIILGAVTTGATISFFVSDLPGGTYKQLYDSANAAKAQGVAANRAYAFPAELAGFAVVKLVLDAGTAVGTVQRKG